jgi:hypothetical protein
MHTSILWLAGILALLFAVMVIYALHRGRDVKASLKILWAVFSFEANAPAGRVGKTSKERIP